MNYYSEIIGTGGHFPVTAVSNQELEKFLDTSDEWIRTRTGIASRFIADPKKGESTGSLALEAGKKALAMSGLSPEEIEMIVVGTVTPDSVMPTVANSIQGAIGAKKAFTFDLQAACSGFVYGLSMADAQIRTGTIKNALVIGAETLSTITNWRDRSTAVLFGDAAGAVVLKRTQSEEHRVVATRLYSDGSEGKILCIPHGYGKVPPYSAEYRADQHKIFMAGAEVFKVATRRMVESTTAILHEHKLEVKDVDFFIFHQANSRIIDMCAKALKVPAEKTWNNVENYGNTSAATLPICLDEAWKAGAVKKGDLILMTTFGGGLTWGSSLIRL